MHDSVRSATATSFDCSPRPRSALRSAFDDADRHEAGDAAGEPRALDDFDDTVDVLVGEGGLLGEPSVRRAAHGDSPSLELSPELRTPDSAARSSSGHRSSGAVAGGPERSLHRSRQPGEDVAGGAHAAWDEHRLSDLPIIARNLL